MTAIGTPSRRRGGGLAAGLELGIDLGTSNTRVYERGIGMVADEPSVIAIDVARGAVLAVGQAARDMHGRTPPRIRSVRPIRQGIVVDFDCVEKLLRYFLRTVRGRRFRARPRLVICVPIGTTSIEQRAVEEAAMQAGARSVHVIEEPMAAAIGAGLPVNEPAGNMVIDIGGGITEVAVISLGGIVTSQSIRIGGDELDDAIISYIKKEYSLIIGERTAEEIKMAIGSAFPLSDEPHAEIRGRDLVSGLPSATTMSAGDVREAIHEPLTEMVAAVTATLDETPPELAADIIDKGMVLTGGGSSLPGMDALLSDITGMPVHVAEHGRFCVAMGAACYLDEIGHRAIA